MNVRTVITLFVLLFARICSAQTKGETYRLIATWPMAAAQLTPAAGTASAQYHLYQNSMIQVRDVQQTDSTGKALAVPLVHVLILSGPEVDEKPKDGSGTYYARKGGLYAIPLTAWTAGAVYYELHRERDPIDIGTLVVPFRYQLSDGSISTGSTLGLYVGYKTDRSRIGSATFLISAGLSLVPVQEPDPADATKTVVETKTGISLAIGVIWEPRSNFQVGFVVGRDHLGGTDGSRYKYNDKTWISFMVGYKFATGG